MGAIVTTSLILVLISAVFLLGGIYLLMGLCLAELLVSWGWQAISLAYFLHAIKGPGPFFVMTG